MNGHPTSSYYVSHDCTAESPTGREPYGDGGSIVVGGVTTTQAVGKANHRAKGARNLACQKKRGMRNADSRTHSTSNAKDG